MPDIDGIESAKLLREITETPIIFLTAKSSDDDKTEAYTSGGDDYLSKPFSSVELLLRIKALIKRGKSNRDAIETDDSFKTVIKCEKSIINIIAKSGDDFSRIPYVEKND